MILIADSGSTKTDWQLVREGSVVKSYRTDGFNPYFQNEEQIATEIETKLKTSLVKDFPEAMTLQLPIHFYGAGCSTPEKCVLVRTAISSVFPKAIVHVHHDLLAAARALCGNTEGIAAIMGTGSNSCYYDGKNIVENVQSLGFILGDEGSGAHIGKLFITDLLNNAVPERITTHFFTQHKLNKELILDGIYKQPMPSRFLASFSKFIAHYKNDPYISNVISRSFDDFFRLHICKYNYQSAELSCVGSVAFHYSDILKKVAEKYQVRINKILESPIGELSAYHTANK